MEALLIVKRELDALELAIKAETAACAQARRSAADTRAANDRVRSELEQATAAACSAEETRDDLESLEGCLGQQRREREERTDELRVRRRRRHWSWRGACVHLRSLSCAQVHARKLAALLRTSALVASMQLPSSRRMAAACAAPSAAGRQMRTAPSWRLAARAGRRLRPAQPDACARGGL
jgi:hypothetical protein